MKKPARPGAGEKMNFGSVVYIRPRNAVVYYGKIRTIDAIACKLAGFSIVRWWVGTDADTLNATPPGDWHWRRIRLPLHRFKARLLDMVVDENWYGCDNVKEQLETFGLGKLHYRKYPALYPKPVNPDNLVVLLHIPKLGRNKAYKRWYHGIDVSEELMKTYRRAYWLVADNTMDMRALYAAADVCVLTKRANGNPRMVDECNTNGIPVYYAGSDVNLPGIIKFLQDELHAKITRNRMYEQWNKHYSRDIGSAS